MPSIRWSTSCAEVQPLSGAERDHFLLFDDGDLVPLLRQKILHHPRCGPLGQFGATAQTELALNVFAVGLDRFHA